MNSILMTIRKMLVGDSENSAFDNDLIIHINSTFSKLGTIADGLPKDFRIEDETSTWDDYNQSSAVSMIKDYVILKTRILFDPPISTAVLDAFKAEASELEWRIQCETDNTEVTC